MFFCGGRMTSNFRIKNYSELVDLYGSDSAVKAQQDERIAMESGGGQSGSKDCNE
jgi:hypothetical protein